MEIDKTRWNARYYNKEYPEHVSEIVKTFYPLAEKGRALDIASGMGRNALFLAEQGFCVDAVDISDVAAAHLTGQHPNLRVLCTDLDQFGIPENTYNLIINIRFLDRRLVPGIKEGLTPGGIAIFSSYMDDGMIHKTKAPSCRDYLLRENELLHAFLSTHILYYRESDGVSRKGPCRVASLVAQRPVSEQNRAVSD